MHYHAYEMAHAVLSPLRANAQALRFVYRNALNPLSYSWAGRAIAAGCEVFEGVTRRYAKPEFGIESTAIDGVPVPVAERVVYSKSFCDLLHFERAAPEGSAGDRRPAPKVLLVAPLSGHYATLLRGTVEAMLPEHDLYVTDWRDARMVPLTEGRFDLNDFIDTIIEFIRFLGPNSHVIAVCQPSVPVLAATAIMATNNDPCQPASLTLMGGPIDTRRNPTAVNDLAASRDVAWFEDKVLSTVPIGYPGFLRRVYPGFIQLSGFMSMNLDRHFDAHIEFFNHLVEGDRDSAQQHRDFYQEFMSVMDLPAEFYLQTVRCVFQDHALPEGTLVHRGQRVDCRQIRRTALMTVEGERDDICGLGQTAAAHDLCSAIPAARHTRYVQPGVGHYGVFNGRRWRTEIQPRIRDMIHAAELPRAPGSGRGRRRGSARA